MSDPASLDNLHDIVVPLPVPWWPPAPGWYWLAGVVVLLAVWIAVRALRRHRGDAYRRAALSELATLTGPGEGSAADLRALPALLKRTALAAYPRERVAALSGPAWWRFLDETMGGTAFGAGAGRVLDTLAYSPRAPLDAAERRQLLAAAQGWLRRHRRDATLPPC